MKKYKDMLIKEKANLKMLRNLVFFLLLIIFTFWFIFKDQDINEIFKTIQSTNITYILLGAFLMLLVFLSEANNVRQVLVALGEKKLSIFKALKLTWIGFFFSGITPAATGGQPVEIYYMTKEKISTANGTMAMLLQLCGFQISTLSLSIISAIIFPDLLKNGVVWFWLLGLLINGAALTFMLVTVFSEKTTRKIINWSIKILKKAKVRNADKKKEKILAGLKQYNDSSVFIKSHKIEFTKAILRVLIQIIFYHSITYCIYRAFGLSGDSFIRIFAMQAVFYTTVSGMPLPGAIGVSETLFLKIFKGSFPKMLLSGAMLIYRVVSFYFYIVLSAIVFIITAVKTKNIVSQIDKDVIEIDGK